MEALIGFLRVIPRIAYLRLSAIRYRLLAHWCLLRARFARD